MKINQIIPSLVFCNMAFNDETKLNSNLKITISKHMKTLIF